MIRNLFFAMQGFRLCGGEEGAMKTDEVCGRPPTPLRVQARNSCEVLYKHCKRQYNK